MAKRKVQGIAQRKAERQAKKDEEATGPKAAAPRPRAVAAKTKAPQSAGGGLKAMLEVMNAQPAAGGLSYWREAHQLPLIPATRARGEWVGLAYGCGGWM